MNTGKTDVNSANQYLIGQLKLLQQNNDLELGQDKDQHSMKGRSCNQAEKMKMRD